MATQTVQSFIEMRTSTEIRVNFDNEGRPETLYHTQFNIDDQLQALYVKHVKDHGKKFEAEAASDVYHKWEIVHGKPKAKSPEMKGAYLVVTTTFDDGK
jgi:hypothetical protein